MLTFSLNKTSYEVMKTGQDLMTHHRGSLNDKWGYGRSWLSVAFLNTLLGKVEPDVDLTAYGLKCEEVEFLKTVHREVPLITTDELKEGEKGVAEYVANYVDENIDYIIESSEYKWAVQEFIRVRSQILYEEGYDLWSLLERGKKNSDIALEKIKNICAKYDLRDLLNVVLGNPECYQLLRGSLT